MPTKDQIVGLIERAMTILVTVAVSRGWIPIDVAKDLGPFLIGAGSLIYAYKINTPQSLARSVAAALPNSTLITSSEMASSTPERNIVSELTNKVVAR
jgi:hypothetical protein